MVRVKNGVQARALPNDRQRFGFTVGLALTALVACGGGPQVKTTPDYAPKVLAGHRVLLVPLAMSDDLGDKRTGIVLSSETRRLASTNACSALARSSREGSVVCPEASADAKVLSEIEQKFALDEPVAAELWSELRSGFQTDYAFLFRPESVSSSNEVTTNATREERARERAGRVFSGAQTFGALGAVLGGTSTVERHTTSDTELGYTVSAVLVDMRSMKVLKVGVHSASASKTVNRNLGYAEAPLQRRFWRRSWWGWAKRCSPIDETPSAAVRTHRDWIRAPVFAVPG